MSKAYLKRAFNAGANYQRDMVSGRYPVNFDDWYAKQNELVSTPDMGIPISQSHVDEFKATEHRFGLRDTIAMGMLKMGWEFGETPEYRAKSAYLNADAMMQERAK